MMRAMHGWSVHEHGHYREKLRWEELPPPHCPEDGVVIRVGAASINFPDMLAIAGGYQVKPPLPFTPGMEAAGTVIRAGARSTFKEGDRVITNNVFGAFAEEMAAPGQSCFAIPEGMNDADAAALLVIYQTGYFGLVHRAQMKAGEILLVHGGAGGVGTAAIQLGKALGATVIATAGSAEKLEVCSRAGADQVINYRDADFVSEVKKLTKGRGADVIYDPVGGDVFDQSTKCIAFSGRLLVIGFASGRIPEIKANRILLKNIAIVGVHWGAYQFHDPGLIHATHDTLCEMYGAGSIKPIIWKQLPLRELPEAIAAVESRDSYGKVLVTP